MGISNINIEEFKKDTDLVIKKLKANKAPITHHELLDALLQEIGPINFRELAELNDEDQKIHKKHYLVCCIEQILKLAKERKWGICKNNGLIYLYNGSYWSSLDKAELETFLGAAAEKMGIDKFETRHYVFKEHLSKQFHSVANLPKPKGLKNTVLINLINGTFEINLTKQRLRDFNPKDFLTYQLPFEYNPNMQAPLFEKYLKHVLPDPNKQDILSEFLGYLFIKNGTLKLEKTLLLYGTGANGKSVFFEIVNALLGGSENVSNHSLQSLTDKDGYYRAMISDKLVNYASEINGKLESSTFKQLVSGEPVSARMPYGNPFTLLDYAKLIFNCNELPREVELTHAFFRRFLIIAFDVSIPDAEQDKELANKIIENELSGVFNWVLSGLNRLLSQKKFTYCKSVEDEIEKYKTQSDSVRSFITDEEYERCTTECISFKEVFDLYRQYCQDSGYRPCSKRVFGDRMRKAGFDVERRNSGMIIFIKKIVSFNAHDALHSPF